MFFFLDFLFLPWCLLKYGIFTPMSLIARDPYSLFHVDGHELAGGGRLSSFRS